MKVGQHVIDHPKGIAGCDHETGLSRACLKASVGASGAFESTHNGCSYRPHRATRTADSGDPRYQLRGNLIPLGVHPVRYRVLHLDWLEGAGPHLKVEALDQDA